MKINLESVARAVANLHSHHSTGLSLRLAPHYADEVLIHSAVINAVLEYYSEHAAQAAFKESIRVLVEMGTITQDKADQLLEEME